VRKNTMINEDTSTSIFTSFKKLIISRLEMLFVFTWNAAVGSLIISRGLPEIKSIIYSMSSTLFITLSVYIYNDIIDRYTDAESLCTDTYSKRIIAHGIVPVNHAYVLVVLSSISGLGIAYLTNIMTFKIGLIYWLVLMLYSFPRVSLKNRFILNTLVKAFGGPFFPLILGGSAIINAVSPLVLFIALVSGTYAFLVIPIVTDFTELEERRIHVFGNNIIFVILIVVSTLLILNKVSKLPDMIGIPSIRKFIYAFFIIFDILIFVGNLNLSVIIPFY
jgi:4-hydroxybenzoate polyprenyltransferase